MKWPTVPVDCEIAKITLPYFFHFLRMALVEVFKIIP